jgi:hypothetical protein
MVALTAVVIMQVRKTPVWVTISLGAVLGFTRKMMGRQGLP